MCSSDLVTDDKCVGGTSLGIKASKVGARGTGSTGCSCRASRSCRSGRSYDVGIRRDIDGHYAISLPKALNELVPLVEYTVTTSVVAKVTPPVYVNVAPALNETP